MSVRFDFQKTNTVSSMLQKPNTSRKPALTFTSLSKTCSKKGWTLILSSWFLNVGTLHVSWAVISISPSCNTQVRKGWRFMVCLLFESAPQQHACLFLLFPPKFREIPKFSNTTKNTKRRCNMCAGTREETWFWQNFLIESSVSKLHSRAKYLRLG